MNFVEALSLAKEHLSNNWVLEEDSAVILEDKTIEDEFGWVFFYESKNYIESDDYVDMLMGNAPIIINKRSGDVHVTGTAEPIEVYIERYKESLEKSRKSAI